MKKIGNKACTSTGVKGKGGKEEKEGQLWRQPTITMLTHYDNVQEKEEGRGRGGQQRGRERIRRGGRGWPIIGVDGKTQSRMLLIPKPTPIHKDPPGTIPIEPDQPCAAWTNPTTPHVKHQADGPGFTLSHLEG